MNTRLGLTVLAVMAAMAAPAQERPKVHLTSSSNTPNARHDHTIGLMTEFAKDFHKLCSDAQATTIAEESDYTVTLEHIERGFECDNRITVSKKEGNVLGSSRKGSIRDKVKTACDLILGDWREGNHSPAASK